jgi:glycosyltransferase involved in cell wall biosynthesis
VGTRCNGIPLAIGDTGFYVPYGDVQATVEAIRKAINSDKGKEARERIKSLFPLERRERELVAEVEELLR